MSETVLTYFPMKGRAESIKIALQLAHLPYTNHFVENWPVEKQEGLKNGTLPFGQVPLLHIDGLDIVQSGAILRYISQNYLSKDMDKVTRVHEDIMIEGWNDFLNQFYGYSFRNKEKLPEYLDGGCKDQLRNLENLYVRYGKRFMVSDVPTVADAAAYSVIRQVEGAKETVLDDFASLKKWKNDFESLEEVKAYNAL